MSLRIRRERDPYTRAVGIVVSRGFGVTVKISAWWLSILYHRRDAELMRLVRAAAQEHEQSKA